MSTLSNCLRPENIKALEIFIRTYKVLSHVLPNCSNMMAPLDLAATGKQSTDKNHWLDELKDMFTTDQHILDNTHSIITPHPADQLWLVTYAALKIHGVSATLYDIVQRKGKMLLVGFYGACLVKHQIGWIPCEIKALNIATMIKHFSPYIVDSNHPTCVMMDSRPCVLTYEKLK